MLSNEELETVLSRLNLSLQARQTVQHIRSSPPSRRVESGKANVACRFASRKMGVVIQAESHKNELAAVVTWEHDDGTYEFYDQPPRIKVSFRAANGRNASGLVTPDFFVIQKNFVGWVECKTEEWLLANASVESDRYVPDGNGGWRYLPGERYAAEYGLGFKVRSSAETDWILHRNLEFLADYLDERCPAPNPDHVEKICSAFEKQAWVNLKDLLDLHRNEGGDPIFRMVAKGMLFADLKKSLLTEPERTLIYRDKAAADAYRIHLSSSQLPVAPNFGALLLSTGQSLIWDGKPWRILNVGDEDVFLEDADQVISSLRRTVLEQLVRDGVVKGLQRNSESDRDKAEAAIRTASPSDFEHALYRYHCIFPEKAEGDPPKASERALRKWSALYRKSAESFGYGFLGLLPKFHLRGNRNRRFDDRVIEIMNDVIDKLYAQPGEKTLVSCFGDVSNQCTDEGLTPPSENAFRAEIRRRRGWVVKVAREGEKAAYNQEEFYWRLERTTLRHGERPFEIGHIDHTELDLQFIGSRKGEHYGKAWLTVLLDAYTRMVLAWVLSFEEPSYRSCMGVIRECIRRHGRISKNIVVDKGPEFQSVYFECLLARLESHKKTRPASKPRFGSLVERFFGISNDAFVHNLKGNNQALQKPRQLSESHDPRKLAVWTLPSFNEAFDGFLEKVYSALEHPALGISPKEAMAVGLAQSGMRAHTLIPYSGDFVIMCLPSTQKGTAKVDSSRGVKIGYIYYWTVEFRNASYARRDVPVRYDPFDLSVAFVWLDDHWAMCRSEYTAEFQGRSEKEIRTATDEIRARMKRNGERRAINATIIARYLGETGITEKLLLQQKRHQEFLQSHDGLDDLNAHLLPSSADGGVLESDDDWDNLAIKYFGDFE